VSALAALPAVAGAAGPGHFRGVVIKRTAAGRAYHAKIHPFSFHLRNLRYHGGPVMHTDANYTIFWVPPGYGFPSGYASIINGFFGNVSAANGASTNVYSVARQYPDSSGSGFTYGTSSGG
jgi:hypothetical protein